MPGMGSGASAWMLTRAGHAPDECEDAIDGDAEAGRFAVAEGASEGDAAGEWARHLVMGFGRDGGTDDWLTGSRNAWQQEIASARYYIETLTHPGDLVFDPFCGGGTTATAAKITNRRYLTCDVDEQAIWIARQRVAEAVV